VRLDRPEKDNPTPSLHFDASTMSDLFAQLQESLGDEYALEREMPPHGASRVFIAREKIFNRAILITVLPPAVTEGLNFERFASDVEQAAALNHPNVVPPLMLGVTAGLPYIITPYVPGVTLRDRLLEQPPLTLEEVVGILRNIADALHAAHAQQIFHHDLSPDAVLLSQRAALITDIGTVRALRTARPADSAFVGNPSYLAPEQLSPDATADHHADVYAWGCLAYEMLTGISPAPRAVRDGKLVAAPYEDPAPITLVRRDVPAALIRLIMRALSQNPESRPANADNLVQVLQTVDVSERAQAERGLTPAYVPAVSQLANPTTVKETRAVGVVPPPTQSRRRLAMIAGGGVIAIAAAVLFAMRTPAPAEEPPLPVVVSTSTVKFTAVMPLTLASTDIADVTFGAGLAVELSQRLAHRGIAVMGAGSVASLAAQRLDPRTIAKRLGVSSILTGSTQRSGDSVQVNVALLAAGNGSTLWSATFNRPIGELFVIEDSITRAVAGVVVGRPQLADNDGVRAETAVPDAHALLLQANGFAAAGSLPMLASAISQFRAAVARDSSYARAHASLALTLALTSALDLDASAARLSAIVSEANRALARDSTLADAWTALAYARAVQGNEKEAERLFRESIERDSSVALAWGLYGVVAAHVGDYATAHARVLRARSLEPSSAIARAFDAITFFGERKYDRAEQATRAIPTLDSTESLAVLTHAESLFGLERDSAAVQFLETRVGSSGDGSATEANALRAYAYARAGQSERAREILLAMRDASRGPLPPRATLAATLAALGDVDSAIGLLAAAVARHDPVLFFFNRAPRFDLLRKDPRGAALFERLER
jgi:eukaryotic-like serine/threonine-protein kinase